MTTLTDARPCDGLVTWLGTHHLRCEVRGQAETYAPLGTAGTPGIDVRSVLEVVAVEADDGRRALIVVEAPHQVDLAKARRRLAAREVRLLDEAQVITVAPGCEPGALPAVGALFGVPTYADYAVRERPRVCFEAGNHSCTVRLDRGEWERSAHVEYGDLIEEEDGPWAPV
jgi:Ala-tRNA(Pro) deacylase